MVVLHITILATLDILDILGNHKIQFQFMTMCFIYEHQKIELGTFSKHFFDFNIMEDNALCGFEAAYNFDFPAP